LIAYILQRASGTRKATSMMTEQKFNQLSEEYQNSRTNWAELAAEVKEGIYSFGEFKETFGAKIGVADAQLKWALRGNVKSASRLADKVSLRYSGSEMFIKVEASGEDILDKVFGKEAKGQAKVK